MKGAVAAKEHYSRENVLDHLRRLVWYGVAVMQSLGTDRDGTEIAIRDEQRAGVLNDPELALLMTAGNGLVAPDPRLDERRPLLRGRRPARGEHAGAGAAAVRDLATRRPDAVKFWVDDRDGTKAKFGPEVSSAITDEAHAHGLVAIAHIFELDDAKAVVRADVDGIAHMVRAPGPDEELVELLTTHGVFACTSMSSQKGVDDAFLQDPALHATVAPEAIAAVRDQLAAPWLQDLVAAYGVLEAGLPFYVEHGVRIVCSPDSGLLTQFPGYAEHRELEAMVRAGMPALQAISAATQVPAEFLGLPGRGMLAAGRRADFIVLDGDPLDDMANTRRIDAVYLRGRAVDRDTLRARLSS